jgi:ferritin-like protein
VGVVIASHSHKGSDTAAGDAYLRLGQERSGGSMANSAGYHEPFDRISPKTRDLHRAYTSLQEELEAVDWYQQRIDLIEDGELKEILEHNRDEEKEHATMILEWIRRNDPAFARQLAMKLDKPGPIVEEEEKKEASGELDLEGRGRRK